MQYKIIFIRCIKQNYARLDGKEGKENDESVNHLLAFQICSKQPLRGRDLSTLPIILIA